MKYCFSVIYYFILMLQEYPQPRQACNLHIVTSPDNQMMGFPFQFEVNGTHYKLKAGQCLKLKLNTDNIDILVKDKRWVNNETVDLHIKAEENLYVRIFWGWKLKEKKKMRCIAEAICKSCYDEYKQKCKKELTE